MWIKEFIHICKPPNIYRMIYDVYNRAAVIPAHNCGQNCFDVYQGPIL